MGKVTCQGYQSVKAVLQTATIINLFQQRKPHPTGGILIFQAQLQAIKLI